MIPAALTGGVAVSALALLFGLGILRLRGAFFALATIGVNQAIQQLVVNFEPWGGATGIYLSLDSYGALGGPMQALWTTYLLIVAVTAASLLAELRHQEFEIRPRPDGHRPERGRRRRCWACRPRCYKAMVYSASAFLPAVAGGLYFFKSGIIEPTSAFNLQTSIEAIVMVMLGGSGTILGPALGAFLYEELRGFLLTAAELSRISSW